MRGTVAKRIRRTVYGDHSTRVKHYNWEGGTLKCIKLRAIYQFMKKQFKRGVKDGQATSVIGS